MLVLALIQIPDEEWAKLAVANPELAERYGRAFIVLNQRAFRVLQTIRYEP
jgi:hypothetical protein